MIMLSDEYCKEHHGRAGFPARALPRRNKTDETTYVAHERGYGAAYWDGYRHVGLVFRCVSLQATKKSG